MPVTPAPRCRETARQASPGRRLPAAALLVLPLGLSALTSLRVLDAPFLLDDIRVVAQAPGLRDLGAQLARLRPPGLWAGGRPVTDVTFALDLAWHGEGTRGLHLTSVALHLAVAGLLFLLGRDLLRRAGAAHPEGVALAVAGLFALHPLQTEAVSYLTQRSEVLASGLYLAALLCLRSAERRGFTVGGVAAWGGSLLAFALGLGTKPIVITLPVAFLLLGLAPAPGPPAAPPWHRRLLLVLPHLALGAAAAWALLHAIEGRGDAGFSIPGLGALDYLRTQAGVVLTYLRLVVWPAGQRLEWEIPVAHALDGPTAVAWAALLALLVAAGWLLARGRRGGPGPAAAAARIAGVGLLWFFLVLAPTSSVVPLADLLAEHRPYLASFGPLLALAVGVERLLARLSPRRAALAAAGLSAAAWSALGLATWLRNAAWESPEALFADAVAKSPHHARAHFGLGTARHQRGDLAGAIEAYRVALALSEGQPVKERQVARNLGIALLGAGRVDEAARALERAAALAPDDARVASLRAQVEWRRGDLAAAEALAERALALQPGEPDALLTSGVARLHRGDAAGGLARLEAADRAAPGDATIQLNLGAAYDLMGRPGAACQAWAAALERARGPALRDDARRRLAARGCPASPRPP